MKFSQGGYVKPDHHHKSLCEFMGFGCVYAWMGKQVAKYLGFDIGEDMFKTKTRPLVVKRTGSLLALYDEQTSELLQGQTSVVLVSHSGEPPKVIVTFEAWGPHGVRFEDEPRLEQ